MPVENDFLVWAAGGTSQIYTQSQYAALPTLGPGVAPGIADPLQANKTWRQTSVIASVIAQFIVANSGQPAIDDGTTATLLTNFTASINALLGSAGYATTSALSSEAATRAAADTALTTNLANEVTRAEAAEVTKVPLAHMGITGSSSNTGTTSVSTSSSFTPGFNGQVVVLGTYATNGVQSAPTLTFTGTGVTTLAAYGNGGGNSGNGVAVLHCIASFTASNAVTITLNQGSSTGTGMNVNFVYFALPTS